MNLEEKIQIEHAAVESFFACQTVVWSREKKPTRNLRSICRSTMQLDGALKSIRRPLKFQPQGDRKQITAWPNPFIEVSRERGRKKRWY